MRKANLSEINIIRTLLQKCERVDLISSLDSLYVESMNDGGMGSLLLIPGHVNIDKRVFGTEIVTAEFYDKDGISVSVALNLDKAENLFELDLWKANFSPILEWPTPDKLRFTKLLDQG